MPRKLVAFSDLLHAFVALLLREGSTGRIPDFFIVGASKCGTTALYTYLSQHPSVFMPLKAPSHFSSDLRNFPQIRSRDAYLRLFAAAPKGALIGEASGMYIYSAVAIQEVLRANPRAKIIVALRKHENAVRSLHMHYRRIMWEDIEDFEDAWRAQDQRAAGKALPRDCLEPAMLQYRKVYCYAEQVRRIVSVVPAKQRHFVIFEEFIKNPQRHYEDVLTFLGLPSDGRRDFPPQNVGMIFRSRTLAHLTKHSSKDSFLHSVLRKLVHAIGRNPLQALRTLNEVPVAKTELRPEFAEELRQYFAPDTTELEGLIGRRLQVWY